MGLSKIYYRRLAVLEYFKDRDGVQEIYDFYVDLGAQGVSSDEECRKRSRKNGYSTYVIRPRGDLDKAVGLLGKALDEAYVKFLKPKYEGATPIHCRVSGTEPSTSEHPPLYHLPVNAYPDSWMSKLDITEKENLGLRPRMNFTKALASILSWSA